MSYFYGYSEYEEEENYFQESCNSGWSEEESYWGPPEWCFCGECEEMEDPWERICCHSHDEVEENMREYDVNCITYHPGFQSVVLDPFVLETAYYNYRKGNYRRGKISNDERGEYKMYRYTAYRQLVRWCWGMLGNENRVDLPSCTKIAIRSTFPPGYSNAPEYS